jgi:hypothetical protein
MTWKDKGFTAQLHHKNTTKHYHCNSYVRNFLLVKEVGWKPDFAKKISARVVAEWLGRDDAGFQGGNFSRFTAILRNWPRQNKKQQPKSPKRKAVRPGSLSSIPDRVERFFLLHSFQTVSGSHQSTLQSVMELKRPGREANHSPPSSAEDKNARSHISASLCAFMLLVQLNKETTLNLLFNSEYFQRTLQEQKPTV